MALPAILGGIVSGAGRAAGSVAKTAGSMGYQYLRDSVVKKAPRAIFNAAGGNRVAPLEALFSGASALNSKMAEKRAERNAARREEADRKADALRDKKEDAEKGLEKSRKASEKAKEAGEANARRQEKAHQEGIASLQKNQKNLLQRISDDIHEMKGLLTLQGKGGTTEGKGGGFLGAIGSILSGVLGGALAFAPSKWFGKLGAKAGGLARGLGRGLSRSIGGAARGIGGLVKGAGRLVSSGAGRALGLVGLGAGAAGAHGFTGATATAARETVEAGAKAGAKASGKGLASLGGKAVGKSIVKKIPVAGLLAGLGFAAYRAAKGDWAGASLEVASGAAGTIPGFGTAASVGIDAVLAKRDYDRENAASLQQVNPEQVASLVSDESARIQSLKNKALASQAVSSEAARIASLKASIPSAVNQPSVLASNTQTPQATILSVLSNMLSLMTDEKKGVFVRVTKDVLTDNPAGNWLASNDSVFERRPTEHTPTQRASRRPNVGSAGLSSTVSTDKDSLALSIYDAARANGFSHEGARILVGEVGRENGLDSNLIFGSHTDPANGASNAGMLSFQGERKDALMKFLSGVPGALDENGNMNRNQANLNGQLAFIRQEMEKRNKTLADSLSSDNINSEAVADRLGREYIRWRIDDPRYRETGIRNRNAFQGKLDSALSQRGSIAGSITGNLMEQTQEAIDQGVKYGFGSKNTRTGKIDCSGWVSQINKNLINDISSQGEELAGSREARRLFDDSAAGIVKNIAGVTGEILGNSELTADALKEGMIIGEDNGNKGWDNGRYKGIDHITQVVKDPVSGQLMISQSSSGKGVHLTPVDEYLSKKNARGTKLYGVDTNAALDQLTSGEYSARAYRLRQESPMYSDAIRQSRTELAEVERESNKPIVVVAPSEGSGSQPMQGAQGGAGLTAPMVTRSNDSSIRRLTDNYMGHSMPIARA